MAGRIVTEGGGVRCNLNQEVTMVPGREGPLNPRAPDRMLHVDARSDDKFTLTWKQGATVISTVEVPRVEVDRRDPELASKIAEEWRAHGSHRAPSDRELDPAVLHTGDKVLFGHIVAIIDAVHTPKRD